MICSKCKEDKLEEEFIVDTRWRRGRGYLCSLCRKQYGKEYYQRNKDKIKNRSSEWVKDNPDQHRLNGQRFRDCNPEYETNKALKKRYGITLEEYNSFFERQGGVCAICGNPETAKDYSGEVRKLSLDHDHATGVVRGLLCNNCNAGIGMLQDSILVIEKALEYLRSYTE